MIEVLKECTEVALTVSCDSLFPRETMLGQNSASIGLCEHKAEQ